MGSTPVRLLKKVAATTTLFAVLAPAAMAQLPNTGPGTDPEAGFGHVVGSPNVLTDRLLATPFDPADEPAPTDLLWSPGTPENDLAAALDDLAGAGDVAAATAARGLALDILEGNPIAKKAYSGIGLLNWNPESKKKTVPANGTVTIKQVRWGEHLISDTWLLEFADPTQPFRIKYEIAELGSAFGSELNPTPLLNGNVGQHSAIQPLNIRENHDLGTSQASRFTDDRGLGAVPEQTRSAIQEVTVAMPPAGQVSAILDPNRRAGHESTATLLPATAARLARLHADKDAAIGQLADAAPEKMIWQALKDADTGDLTALKAAGSENRELVGAMRSRTEVPSGVSADPAADATLVLQNNEAYLSRRAMHLEPGASLTVQVVNRDKFAHDLSDFDLHQRDRIFGAWDWGRFDWADHDRGSVAAGAQRTLTITPADDTFALWIGDVASGDQAGAVISLDREIRQEALRFGAGTVPIHSAPDANGDVWVTLAGVDTIARIKPAANLADSALEKFPLPGGRPDAGSPLPPLTPSDITVDGHGIVWSTLGGGNAIARIDPAKVNNGTGDGITKIALDDCPVEPGCVPEIPPVPNELPTRRPTRIKSYIDGQGNTVLWFVEAGASAIGVLRVTQAGEVLNQAHFTCNCIEPESLDVGPDGSIYFAEIVENRIGRLRPDVSRPYSPSAARLDHYDIPCEARVEEAGFPNGFAMTSLPLSVAVDGRGRVWFSESACSSVAYLEPDKGSPNTSEGFTELEQPGSAFRSPSAPADIAVDRGNHLWWAGEYGDQIEQLKPNGDNGLRFRGSVRRGLTEGPIPDKDGNLWIIESGGNLITRITGVSDGPLVPFGRPAGFEADTTNDTLTGERLRDTSSVSVTVTRGGAVVAQADAPVTDGRFSIGAGDWQGEGDQIRPDDEIKVDPQGAFDRASLRFRVANLAATVNGDGSVSGTATSGGQALADRVNVSGEGHSGSAGIDGADGAWRVDLGGATSGTVSWSNASVAAGFTTVTHFAAAPAPGDGAETPAEGGTPDQAQPPAPTGQSRTTNPKQPKQPRASTACAARQWLYGSARAPRLLLLGLTRAQLRACLGAPDATKAARSSSPERWSYGKGLTVQLRGGKVVGYTLTSRRFKSARGRLGVGSTVRSLAKVLPRLRRVGRTDVHRVTLGSATIRLKADRRGRIISISVARKSTRRGS